jgi:hypothetical protein
MPKRGSDAAVSLNVASSPCTESAPGTSRSGMWIVASTTRNRSDQNIMAASRAPQRCASKSVWPRQVSPAAASASLLIGAVTSASASPASVAEVAETMAS